MKTRVEEFETESAEETQALAGRLAAEAGPGTVVCLHGDLGAGKTCFAQGVAKGLGVRRAVGSPTFTLINEYRGRLPLAHIDLYRVRGAVDAFSLGLEDYLTGYDGVVVIEWAERVAEELPEGRWEVWMSAVEEVGGAISDRRRVRVERPDTTAKA